MRVIAGIAKGRTLVAPPGDDVRPTTDRTKEALFSILQMELVGASVLDLFAGAGSLGIEALSRGAAHVTFVEKGRRALESLHRNLDETGLGAGAQVVRGDVLQVLEDGPVGAPFDIVLLDPPYGIDRTVLLQVLTGVLAHTAPEATITLELGAHGQDPRWPDGVLVDEPRRYGDTILHVGHVVDPLPEPGEHVSVRAVIPGSFDPVTQGHLDIIERAASRFDDVVVAVLTNPGKQPLFTADQRVDLIERTTPDLANVSVDRFTGLLVDFCHDRDIRVIVKGLRAVSDFEYELQMAQMNQRMGDVETLFMTTNPEYSYLSSSLVKEVARFNGPLQGVVPDVVAEALQERYAELNAQS